MRNAYFDREGFYRAVDEYRTERGVSWRQLARETGLSPSTVVRIHHGEGCDVHAMAALTAWAGLSADDFIVKGEK